MRRAMIFGLLATSGVLLVPAASPAEPARTAELKKLHILMVFDTKGNDLAKSVRIDEWRMRVLWKETIPGNRYHLTVFTGDKVTRSGILAYYRNLRVGPGEGAVFYYAGHAARDPRTGKHYFNLAGDKPLFRSDLVAAMEATRAGLVALLTDCCSTPRQLTPMDGAADSTDAVALNRGLAARIHPTVRSLLFLARGTVDVTAATDNPSWSDVLDGGVFTRSLYQTFKLPVRTLDANRDGTLTWQEFFPHLQRRTQTLFKKWREEMIARGETDINARTQKPHAFSLGQPQAVVGKRHAVLAIENATAKLLRYRYRWGDRGAWAEAMLRPGQTKMHVLDMSCGHPLPPLEAQFGTGRRTDTLAAGEWRGVGQPDIGDGKHYRVRINHE